MFGEIFSSFGHNSDGLGGQMYGKNSKNWQYLSLLTIMHLGNPAMFDKLTLGHHKTSI